MGVCGSTYCSVLVNVSRVSLVSKHIDTNLWQVDICMVWVSLKLSSLVSISTIVVCVISWYVSGKYRIPLQHLRGIILIGCCLRNPVYTTASWVKAATPTSPPPPPTPLFLLQIIVEFPSIKFSPTGASPLLQKYRPELMHTLSQWLFTGLTYLSSQWLNGSMIIL